MPSLPRSFTVIRLIMTNCKIQCCIKSDERDQTDSAQKGLSKKLTNCCVCLSKGKK